MLLHYFWLTTFLIMTYISTELMYRFSNICKPWFLKKGYAKDNVKYCWLISCFSMTVPVGLNWSKHLNLAYASSRGICFIEPQFHIITFFIGPTLFLISVNTICFIITTCSIHKTRPGVPNISKISDRSMVLIFTKIGSLMGVTWLFTLVPLFTNREEFWYVFVVLNGLQGVYIYLSSGIFNLMCKEFKTKLCPNNTSTQNQAESFRLAVISRQQSRMSGVSKTHDAGVSNANTSVIQDSFNAVKHRNI